MIPWIDQALGKPTERHEVLRPSTLSELEQLDSAQLEALVALGRNKRLMADAVASVAGNGNDAMADNTLPA